MGIEQEFMERLTLGHNSNPSLAHEKEMLFSK